MSPIITTLENGNVRVSQIRFDGVSQEEFTLEREYTVQGAYVYQVQPNGALTQACKGLMPSGSTLRAGDDLEATIRKTLNLKF